ncbi:MAG: hypothetical protein ABIN58_02775, partial [candidate division WOR-3 bacterium]
MALTSKDFQTVEVTTDLLIIGGGMAACGAAVEAAYRGGMLMPGSVARLVLARFDQRDVGQDYQLSAREMD